MNNFVKRLVLVLFLVCISVTFTSAKRTNRKQVMVRPLGLSSLHIVDHNGVIEAVTGKDRLQQFLNVDFLSQQPYQKVLRIYERDPKGNIRSIITSYFPNGNVKQYLDVINGRANGKYQEWHANGKISVMAQVIGGTPDITSNSEKTWLFDGISYAWNEDGQLVAEIPYSQGVLEGISIHYHDNGWIWKKVPYCKKEIEGVVEIYKCNGELLLQSTYCKGLRHGYSIRYWGVNKIASQEEFCQNSLSSGSYYDQQGCLIAQVQDGTGTRAIFQKEGIQELQTYKDGVVDGEIKVFNNLGVVSSTYKMRNGLKHGEEVTYFENKKTPQPHLSIQWSEGEISGISRSWYPNGMQQSQRELSKNSKNGISTAWYRDGSMMLMEEYEKDKLIRGDYIKKGERIPVSQVRDREGLATIFDEEGNFVQKVHYVNGKPEI